MGEKGDFKKTYARPRKKRLEKQGGENKDITPGWSLPDTHVSPQDTHVSPQDTHVSLPDTHVSPPDTHVSPPATHVALPATHVSLPAGESSPGAKSQKTCRKLLIFHEIDFPSTVFNENRFILCKKTYWKQKQNQKYTFPIKNSQNEGFRFSFFCKLFAKKYKWQVQNRHGHM